MLEHKVGGIVNKTIPLHVHHCLIRYNRNLYFYTSIIFYETYNSPSLVCYVGMFFAMHAMFFIFQARNKPADGSGIGGQKLQAGQRTPTHGPKGAQSKATGKPTQKPTGQKGQPIKQAPAKVAAAAVIKTTKKTKKGGKHHQHDLIVTIDLVSDVKGRYTKNKKNERIAFT